MSPRQGCLSPLGRMMERPPRVVGVLPSFTSVLPLIPLASTDYGMVHLFIPLLLIALSLLLPPLQASNCSLPCMKYPPTPSVGSRPDAGFNPLPEVCLATYSSHCYCILSTTVPPPLYPLPSREGLRSRRDATVSTLMAPSSPQLLPQLQQRRWQRACRGGNTIKQVIALGGLNPHCCLQRACSKRCRPSFTPFQGSGGGPLLPPVQRSFIQYSNK